MIDASHIKVELHAAGAKGGCPVNGFLVTTQSNGTDGMFLYVANRLL